MFENLRARKEVLHRERQNEKHASATPGEAAELLRNLEIPVTDTPWIDRGVMNFSLEGRDRLPLEVRITYASADGAQFTNYAMRGGDPDSLMYAPNSEHYRRITNLVLVRGKREFDLSTVLGEEWSVYTHAGEGRSFFANSEEHGIENESHHVIFAPDMRSRLGLYVLFHELGHVMKDRVVPIKDKDLIRQGQQKAENALKLSPVQKKAIIEHERAATAYALNVLRDFLNESDLEQMRRMLHDALESYHVNLQMRDW